MPKHDEKIACEIPVNMKGAHPFEGWLAPRALKEEYDRLARGVYEDWNDMHEACRALKEGDKNGKR